MAEWDLLLLTAILSVQEGIQYQQFLRVTWQRTELFLLFLAFVCLSWFWFCATFLVVLTLFVVLSLGVLAH